MSCPLKIDQHLALISIGGPENALVIRITLQAVGTDLGLGESKTASNLKTRAEVGGWCCHSHHYRTGELSFIPQEF